MMPALLVLLHGDDPRMDLLYFWAAVLLALTPVVIFGGIGIWLARKIWKERKETSAERGVRNAELP
ncbi:MAG: hypothetical protein E6K55_07510 [Gemmatimonadetes bacterium]|nr:MAG: hypothetical protein E6K55_07510 [Gemmatimonadota bacterium]